MEHWFDGLSRALAGKPSRRQTLRALGVGLFGLIGARAAAAPDEIGSPGTAAGPTGRQPFVATTTPHMDCDLFCGQFPPGPFRTSCRNACVQAGGDPGALAVVWTQTDPTNCGSAGNVCPAGQICSNGLCLCPPGTSNCGGVCKNLQSDNVNCGACGHVCPAGQVCSGGTCAVSCQAGQTNCGGACVNQSYDPNNCGSCGHQCTAANGTAVCNSSQCVLVACSAGYADCDGLYPNGCETNINTDKNNCGACGHQCVVANGTATCVNGQCGIGTCNAGFANCDNNPATGCEINTQTDVNNCGSCGNVCQSLPNATMVCQGGQCVIAACNAGFANCDGVASNGCETNITNNVNNCGGCGIVCPSLPNATVVCQNGQCAAGACNAGYANCDGNPANGCEINITNNASNCGACGNSCLGKPNVAVAVCSNGACLITACNAGFANCNNNTADGCEINTNTDKFNCGGCGIACASGKTCVNGACV